MKTLFAILSTFLTLSGYVQNVNTQVQKIDKEVKAINALPYAVKTYAYSNKCGVVKAIIKIYHKSGVIKKITDIGIGDDDKAAGKWNYQYYYQNGTLIFSHEMKQYFDNGKNKYATEDIREHFVNNRIIKQTENGRTTFPKNKLINQSDIRYDLKSISKKSDINKFYKCPN